MQSASALEGDDIINANDTPAVIVGLRTRDICDPFRKPMAHILSLPEQRMFGALEVLRFSVPAALQRGPLSTEATHAEYPIRADAVTILRFRE
jgi:hypothetical protein